MKPCLRQHGSSQRGIALVVVMVMLLLTTFVLLASNRVGWLNEKLVGSESDHERAFAAAEALIRDAELDINGRQADGQPCAGTATFTGCRAANAAYFPFGKGDDDLDIIAARVASGFEGICSQGICLPDSTNRLEDAGAWTAELANMQAVGATYGQYTGANPRAAGNPLLTAGQAWYWVEVFRYPEIFTNEGIAASAPRPAAEGVMNNGPSETLGDRGTVKDGYLLFNPAGFPRSNTNGIATGSVVFYVPEGRATAVVYSQAGRIRRCDPTKTGCRSS